MKKGVVLSVHKRYITILTPQGEFVRSIRQNRSYEIGEEIHFIPAENPLKGYLSFLHVPPKKVAAISVLLACILFLSIITPRFSNEVSAYMTIDVNPSIELGMNDELEVVELTGLNADGKLVIGKLKQWKNKDLSIVAKNIVLKTKELGYLNDSTRKVIVSTTVIDEGKKVSQKLNQEITTISKQMPLANTEVKVVQATESDRNKAKQRGISTGKFIEQNLKEKKQKEIKINYNKGKSEQKGQDKTNKKASIKKPQIIEKKIRQSGNLNKIKSQEQIRVHQQGNVKSNRSREDHEKSNLVNRGSQEKKKNHESKGNNVNQKNQGNKVNKEHKIMKVNKANQVKKEYKINQGNKEKKETQVKHGNNGNRGKGHSIIVLHKSLAFC